MMFVECENVDGVDLEGMGTRCRPDKKAHVAVTDGLAFVQFLAGTEVDERQLM